MRWNDRVERLQGQIEQFVDPEDCPSHVALEHDDLIGQDCPVCKEYPEILDVAEKAVVHLEKVMTPGRGLTKSIREARAFLQSVGAGEGPR